MKSPATNFVQYMSHDFTFLSPDLSFSLVDCRTVTIYAMYITLYA